MATKESLVEMPDDTSFPPLEVLGYCLTRTRFLTLVWTDTVFDTASPMFP